MGRRQDFHAILVSQYDDLNAEPCVKYQPGPSVTLNYPAIIYKLSDLPGEYADNDPYHWAHRYEVQVIDRKADSELRERVRAIRGCRFKTAYTVENLYHYVFEIIH